MSRQYESIKYTFSESEIREMGEQLARETESLIDLKERKSTAIAEANAMLKATGELIMKLSAKITAGYEMRDVECMVMLETPRPGMKRIIRVDTSEIVRDEAMTFAEMQGSFGFAEPDDGPQL